MRNLKDTIYEDDEIIVIKKHVDSIGHFEPGTWLSLISIAIQPLKEWEDFGLQKIGARKIVSQIHKELKSCLSKN